MRGGLPALGKAIDALSPPNNREEEEALAVASEAHANIARYDAELMRREIAPNGDDYNNIIDMLNGHGWRPPHLEGR